MSCESLINFIPIDISDQIYTINSSFNASCTLNPPLLHIPITTTIPGVCVNVDILKFKQQSVCFPAGYCSTCTWYGMAYPCNCTTCGIVELISIPYTASTTVCIPPVQINIPPFPVLPSLAFSVTGNCTMTMSSSIEVVIPPTITGSLVSVSQMSINLNSININCTFGTISFNIPMDISQTIVFEANSAGQLSAAYVIPDASVIQTCSFPSILPSTVTDFQCTFSIVPSILFCLTPIEGAGFVNFVIDVSFSVGTTIIPLNENLSFSMSGSVLAPIIEAPPEPEPEPVPIPA